jgi:glutamate/tyrosine decarboxylase-like PLP-dependent enzyme
MTQLVRDLDAGRVTDLAAAVEAVAPALDAFAADPSTLPRELRSAWLPLLDRPLPRQGAGADEVLRLLREVVVPNGLRIGAGGFSGWVTTSATTVPAVAALSALVAGGQRYWLQPYNELEGIALGWLRELFSLPEGMQGVFVSGGSVANLVGLGAARQAAGERLGVDPARDGVGGLPQPRLYASSEIHHVVHRAAAVLGLGREAVVELPVDEGLRLDPGALRAQLAADRAAGRTPIAVAASAGTVNSGAVDPIAEMLEICREHDVWLQVDGAYGLPGMLDPEVAALFEGVAGADSVAVDPHKWLATGLGCGAVFVRDAGLLGRAFSLGDAEYLEAPAPEAIDARSQFTDFGVPYLDFGVEQSAPSRGVQVWSVLLEIGAEGFAERVRRHNGFARTVQAAAEASPVLEVVAPATLSICCFRYVPEDAPAGPDREAVLDALNRELLRSVQERGRVVPSGTEIGGRFAIRPCFINPRTTAEDVQALLDEVEACGAEAWGRLGG